MQWWVNWCVCSYFHTLSYFTKKLKTACFRHSFDTWWEPLHLERHHFPDVTDQDSRALQINKTKGWFVKLESVQSYKTITLVKGQKFKSTLDLGITVPTCIIQATFFSLTTHKCVPASLLLNIHKRNRLFLFLTTSFFFWSHICRINFVNA